MGSDTLRTLHPEQEEALGIIRPMIESFGYALFMAEMRFGKTYVALELARRLKFESVIITCPKQVVPFWEAELEAFGLHGYVYPYSMLSLYKTKPKGRYDFCILDEIHNLRRYSSRTRTVGKLAWSCRHRLGLTGTPLNRSALEYYYPLKILSGPNGVIEREKITKKKWLQEWGCDANMGRGTYPKLVLRPDKAEEFYEKLSMICHSRLNPRIKVPEFKYLPYQLSEEQEDYIKKLNLGVKQVAGVSYVQTPLSQGMAHVRRKVEQVQSGFLIGDKLCTFFETEKYALLKDTIDVELERGHLVIVWYQFIYERAQVLKMYGPEVTLWKRAGDEKRLTPDIPILLCHTRSAGSGLEIGHADTGIYLGVFSDFINLKQSNYRLVSQEGEKDKTNYVLACDSLTDRARMSDLDDKESLFRRGYTGGR